MDDLPQEPAASEPSNPASQPLTYEETPVIGGTGDRGQGTEEEAQTQEPQVSAPTEPPPPPAPVVRKRLSLFGFIGNLFLFVLLFGVGMWLSTVIRLYLPGASAPASTQTQPSQTTASKATPSPVDPYAGWQTYQVLSSTTRQPVAGVSFKLPEDVLSPICDGSSCISQGTYLPGGTRFTVAARGSGQALRDYRGAIVTDVGGQPFATKDALVSGRAGVAFTGTFTGTTIGGYAFSRMAGFMIPVTDTLAVEINHFTPSGITADFETDASLFDKILASVVVAGAPGGEKGAVMPVNSAASPSTASPTVEPLR